MSAEPTQAVRTERSQKRVRAFLEGDLVADTSAPLLVWENTSYPAYYIPAADIRADLIPAGQSERRPRLGEAELLHVKTAAATAELAARRYPDSPVAELRDAVRLDWGAMSEWLEEDEPVYLHPRSPYTKIDILASSRLAPGGPCRVTDAGSRQAQVLVQNPPAPPALLPTPPLTA